MKLTRAHNRLNHHMSTKLKLIPSPLRVCGKENQDNPADQAVRPTRGAGKDMPFSPQTHLMV